jgi:hypothetical protein
MTELLQGLNSSLKTVTDNKLTASEGLNNVENKIEQSHKDRTSCFSANNVVMEKMKRYNKPEKEE